MAKKKRTVTTSAPVKAAPASVNEYTERLSEQAKEAFAKFRSTIRSALPKTAEEVISYRIPAVAQNGIIVWFAAFSDHCSLFPTASVIDVFSDELRGYTISKGTIHFPFNKPLPTALIKRIVKARVKEKASKDRR